MNPELEALLTDFMAGPGSFIILICLAIIGLHLGVIVWDWIERNFRA